MGTEAPTQQATRAAGKQPGPDLASLPWVRLLPLAGLLLSIVASATYGFPTGLIVIGAVFLLTGIWNLWVSLQIVAGDRPTEVEAPGSYQPSHEQEQKAFLLRALEDLEFERSVGKIDDEDYQVLRQQFREQAKQALEGNQGAKSPSRRKAEALAKAYIEQKGQEHDKEGDDPVKEGGETS